MKKTVAIVLLAMLMFSLPACSPSAPKAPAAPADGEVTSYEEKMTISYAAVGMVEGVDYNADPLSQVFLEKFNFTWDPILLTWDNWDEKARIWINANDMPDFTMWNFNYGDYVNYTEQELLMQLPEGWKTRWPNMASVYESTGVGPALEEKMGGAYMIPRIIYFNKPTDPLTSHQNLWVRKDWMQELGFEVKEKYTMPEIMEFARALKVADPVGNGRTIPIDMDPETLARTFVLPSNTRYNLFYKGEDGKHHWGAADEATLTGLALYSQAYREGLLNPDFFALKNLEQQGHYTAGLAGVIFQGGFGRIVRATHEGYIKNTQGVPEDDLHMAYLVREDGKHHEKEIPNFWSASIFSPAMAPEKFNRLMDVLEYSASEEGQDLIRMGFEGKEWERKEDGSIEILRERDENGEYLQTLDKIYPSLDPLYNNLTILPDDFGMRDPGLDIRYRNIVDAVFAGKQRDGADAGTILPIDWDTYFYTSPTYEKTRFTYGEEFAKLIVMDGDIETNWRNWVAEKAPLVDLVLKEMNEGLT